MYYGRREPQTEREKYLEDELHRAHETQQRRYEEELRRREQRAAEIWEDYEKASRRASDWPEALRKQQRLYQREADLCKEEGFEDDFFGPGAHSCERALELWAEEEQIREADIADLQAQIAALRDQIRLAVAARLIAESPGPGWLETARALREEDPENWLQW